MRLLYVFDTTEPEGYLMRVPAFLAIFIVNWSKRPLDCFVTPNGI